MAPAEPVLALSGLCAWRGRAPVLSGIGIALHPGEAVGVLGANGAGKTTLLDTISGFLRRASGGISFRGEPILGEPPHRIVRRGVVQVSQERDLFGHLTVLDNLRLGAVARGRAQMPRNLDLVFGYFPRLRERRDQRADTLSGGEQQMLAIGRAVMAEPEVLMLDEPSAGLSPLFVGEIGTMMAALRRDRGLVLLLVEQNMALAARVVDRFHVLKNGRIVAEGRAAALLAGQEELVASYYL